MFDPTIISSNEALGKIIKLTFLVVSFFTLVPLGCYLVFKSQAVSSSGTSAVDTSYTRLSSKYSYCMFPFVPMALIYTIMLPFSRVRWVILLATVALSTYYLYKETLTLGKQTLTYSTYKTMAACVTTSTVLFALLFKYYFISI